ncbi:MAG: hypothetical protein QOD66_161 [Solirubrobacteraceae bacterium]|jgi:hypothetical protein|nr:hypothetical protein [Solirubrobacteraceae bacterium]
MAQTSKIAYLLERLAQGVAAHDRENPEHHTWGVGMSHFDIERLGLEEGEQILPGVVLQADGGVTGAFRVLCDGDHDEEVEEEQEEMLDAVASDEVAEPVYAPGQPGEAPQIKPPF